MDSDRRICDTQTAKAEGAQEEQGANSGDKLLTASGTKPRQAEKTSQKSHEERKELLLSERGPGQGPCSPPATSPSWHRVGGGARRSKPLLQGCRGKAEGAIPVGRTWQVSG